MVKTVYSQVGSAFFPLFLGFMSKLFWLVFYMESFSNHRLMNSKCADSWQQVGLLLVTSFNCGWIFSFPNLIMVPLSWKWGVICLVVVGLYTAYANWLLASFQFVNGQRFIRYRDIMGFLFGEL